MHIVLVLLLERDAEHACAGISQPHVRPIKRGKPGAATMFGAKISVRLINGYNFVDRISWDSYNGDLSAMQKNTGSAMGLTFLVVNLAR